VELGLTTIPKFPMDATDRNRTSPFAFTGNKFEFRMVGSSQSLAGPNTMLNAAVSEVLGEVADRLESCKDVTAEVSAIIKEFYKAHKRIIFNGNGYCGSWIEDAQKRKLPNLTNTVEALSHLNDDEYVKLFSKHGIFSPAELRSRQEIYLETYSKQINIEAGIMLDLAMRMIVPAANRYLGELSSTYSSLASLGIEAKNQKSLIDEIAEHIDEMIDASDVLERKIAIAFAREDDALEQAKAYREEVIPAMAALREIGDHIERHVDDQHWPMPTYEDMLFRL
jgi:glutamine synthetase